MGGVVEYLAGLSLIIWIYLILFRGNFWRADYRFDQNSAQITSWPEVIALVPARNESDVIGQSVAALLAQDYPGTFHVVLIDDHSEDDTQAQAQAAGRGSERLDIVAAAALAPGWSGKLWALAQGRAFAREQWPEASYLWLSDADIAHPPDTLRRLMVKAEAERLDLVSLMVTLSCQGFWERLLIPPFILFFQKLYPFAWVANPKRRTAAAAGGCVLVSAECLDRAGGFAAIKGALIDDCALARLIKRQAAVARRGIWLGLTRESVSLRPYSGLDEIWRMVARSAYTQLHHSKILLLGTLLGMVLTYLVPPLAVVAGLIAGSPLTFVLGLAAWGLMTLAAWPCNRFYGLSIFYAFLLPFAASLYAAMTFDSARQHWSDQGGRWKGRVQARHGDSPAGLVERGPED